MVWQALNSAEVLQSCIPGCTEMTGSVAEGFEAVVTQKIGPVKATFHGAIALSNIIENESYHITGEGKGGAAGFAKGGAVVRLADVEGGTELSYTVEAKVGGKLAQLGSRLVDGVAKKLADQFFENFGEAVAPAEKEQDEIAKEETSEAEAEEEKPKKGWFRKLFHKKD